MELAEVFIEHPTIALSRPFTYISEKPVQPGCRVFVPFGRQKLTGLVLGPAKAPDDPKIKLKPIAKVLDESPVLNEEQLELAKYLARRTISPLMAMVHCMLPNALDARSSKPDFRYELWLKKTDPIPGASLPGSPQKTAEADGPNPVSQDEKKPLLNKAQQQAYDLLPGSLPLRAAKEIISDYMIQTLVKKGVLKKEKEIINHGTLPRLEQQPWPALNAYQENALQAIRQSKQQTVLLHGVTGSGKTEVFFHLAREALEKGQQVLILVPEISLTPMMEKRIASRFDADVYACHSRLSDSEMVSVWNNLKQAGPCIVIGTRKSVFLPFSNLGLIIVDEEHDSSYKQDSAPRYHARDAAEFRAKWHNCRLVLASATPSLESYSRALKHVYGLAVLPVRAAGKDAKIRLVDLKFSRTFCNYSAELMQAIMLRMAAKEKTLILLNRRGYLPTVRCQSCHEYVRCEECNVPLSFHKGENALVCHVCGARYPIVDTCPHCHSHALAKTGQGTERLEEESASLFPNAKIIRMDHDTTRFKGAHEKLLQSFDQEGDILMGTQMIAKGLDFHDITLCGILSIDTLLARPDYLASERAYQLAEQAAGRAGRGSKPGDVLIQTFNPDHFVLRCVQNHNYKDFFVQEMKYRHAGNYPPYVFMATVIVRHDDPVACYNKAMEMKERFEKSGVEALGPLEISWRNKQPRFRLVLKDKDDEHLIGTLWQAALWFEKNASKCKLDINVHPMNLEE